MTGAPETAPSLSIRLDDLTDPRIADFLQEHLNDMRRVSPPESVHALDLDRLRQPGIHFWSAWLVNAGETTLVGTAAIKRLDKHHAELKSMRTSAAWRGNGVGQQMLQHIMKEARQLGFQRLSLETGSQPFFAPAQSLYRRYGFTDCAPFGGYQFDRHSCFMTRLL